MSCSDASHAELKHVLVWPSLPRPRLWSHPWGEVHEMRDCPDCGSTLLVLVHAGDVDAWEAAGCPMEVAP